MIEKDKELKNSKRKRLTKERKSKKGTRRQKLHQVCWDRFDNFFNWRHNFSLLLQSTSKDKKRKKERKKKPEIKKPETASQETKVFLSEVIVTVTSSSQPKATATEVRLVP